MLLSEFSFLNKNDNTLSFYNVDDSLFKVLEFISTNKIRVIKLEKTEPTLESLFMEVVR